MSSLMFMWDAMAKATLRWLFSKIRSLMKDYIYAVTAIVFISLRLQSHAPALAGVAQFVGRRPADPEVEGLISGQGVCLGGVCMQCFLLMTIHLWNLPLCS